MTLWMWVALLAPPGSADAVALAAASGDPSLRAIEARTEALRAAIPAARAWADPVVGAEYSNMPLTTPWPGEHPMSGVQLRVSQAIPLGDKLGAREDLAKAQVLAVEAMAPVARNRLGAAAREAYFQLALARQLGAVVKAHLEVLEPLIEVVKVRYEVGQTHQYEWVQLQVLRDRLTDDLADAEARAASVQAALNAALRRAPDARVETPKETRIPALADAEVGSHPQLQVLSAQAAAARAGADRADAERVPDLTLMAGYRVRRGIDGGDEGEDFISVGAAIPLPLWNDERWGSQAAQHRATATALEAEAEQFAQSLTESVAAARVRWRRAKAQVETIETKLIPAARTALESTLAAYRVGRATFQSVYQAQRQLLELERQARVARHDGARAAVAIRSAFGLAGPGEEE